MPFIYFTFYSCVIVSVVHRLVNFVQLCKHGNWCERRAMQCIVDVAFIYYLALCLCVCAVHERSVRHSGVYQFGIWSTSKFPTEFCSFFFVSFIYFFALASHVVCKEHQFKLGWTAKGSVQSLEQLTSFFLCVAIVELIYHFWCLSEFVLNLFSFENRLECARVMNSQSLVQLETSILCANVCFLFDACTRYACQYVTRSYLHTRSKQKWLISSVGLQLHRGTKKRAVYSSIASESILIYSMFLFLTMLFSFMFRIPISRYNVRARRGGKHALSFGTHQ